MKPFGKQGLWVLTGAAFLLLGAPKKAWAGVPELSQIPLVRAFLRDLKQEPPGQAELLRNRQGTEKVKVLFVSPISFRQP
ncbi:MAG: hypothetical protein JWM16_3608 [Verrucomicrobiales bacterium]|nr:hypothetical protein [Verrucomicrobiales bacterium]